ncbi:MAG: hypothetical protein PHR83_08855 [Paludibacter sp.]|nr:hypothetical protein [Paludibacter sp.]
MNQFSEPNLEYNSVYHIYNCGIDGCDIFVDDDDYNRFLSKYAKYIEPIADTYAWSLLGNHFHVVVRIKNETEIKTLVELGLFEDKTKEQSPDKKPDPTKQFSHLFNSYAQYFNYKYKRHGALFERSFKRKLIDNRPYFKRCLIYVHQNPIKHGFVERLTDYRYTSFNTILSSKVTLLKKEKVLSMFDGLTDFQLAHVELVNLD